MTNRVKAAINGASPLHAAAVAAITFLALGFGFATLTGEHTSLPEDLQAIDERVEVLEKHTERATKRWLYSACRLDGLEQDACVYILDAADRSLLQSMRSRAGR